jgi:hypothetical protein
VGRVPGIRAKKRRLEHQQPETRVQICAPPVSVIASSSTDTSSLTGDDEEPPTTRWAQDSILDMADNNTDFLQNHDPIMTSMGNTNYTLPAIDFNLETLLQPFPASPPTQQTEPRRLQTPTARPPPNPIPHPQRDLSDSQFVIDCTQIVGDLENYIAADLKSFKIVLGLVKRALERVFQLSDTQQAARNMRCTILLTAIMYQIVELLDVCYTMQSDDSHSNPQSNPSPFSLRPATSLLLPGLGIGDFGIDAEEQRAWRSQMILKEVRQAGEVLRKMKMLAAKGPEQMHPDHGRSRGECFVDLELRLTHLADRIMRRR